MSEPERLQVPVEVEVSTRQERERRELLEPRPIEPDGEVDWRSYGLRTIPKRWRA